MSIQRTHDRNRGHRLAAILLTWTFYFVMARLLLCRLLIVSGDEVEFDKWDFASGAA